MGTWLRHGLSITGLYGSLASSQALNEGNFKGWQTSVCPSFLSFIHPTHKYPHAHICQTADETWPLTSGSTEHHGSAHTPSKQFPEWRRNISRSTEPGAWWCLRALLSGTLLPQVEVSQCHSQRGTTAGRTRLPGRPAQKAGFVLVPCGDSDWGTAGFQMDFLSFIFLSKGLITFRSPDSMGIMSLFYPYQYNAQ